tara:strand:- start:1003 stop:1602 length:600 start_codon:yes stop_codon:yes gene_type:complete
MSWESDTERILEKIRVNSVQMSNSHKGKYFTFKRLIKWFKVPTIVLSSIGSVSSVGLTNYLDQQHISVLVCGLALFVSILNSIEMFLKINESMEQELEHSKLFYNLSINIQKTLLLDREHRIVEASVFLERSYSEYVKLMEQSNLLLNVQDKLTELPKKMSSIKKLLQTKKSDSSNHSSSSSSSTQSPIPNKDDLEEML